MTISSAQNILGLIGNTPAVAVEVDGRSILAKAEFGQPTGSHKDRVYLRMIEAAERRGDLRPGMTIIEASTGNAGAACALVGRLKGYPVIVVMPDGMSEERKKLISALGAELVITPGAESDQDLARQKVLQVIADQHDRYWCPAQFDNPDNVAAHYEGTGPELYRQAGGKVDVFVAAVGSGATLTGVGRYLREQNPGVRIYAVEPAECPTLSRGTWGSHDIQGIGDGFVPRNLDVSLLTGVITVTSGEAIAEARTLCLEQGLVVGISTGCNVAAVRKLFRADPGAGAVATMLFDTGQKYYSSALFGVKQSVEIPDREHALDEYSSEQRERYAAGLEVID